LLRVIENLDVLTSLNALTQLLQTPQARRAVVEALLKVRTRVDAVKLAPVLGEPLQAMWKGGERELAARAAGAFRVNDMTGLLVGTLQETGTPAPVMIATLRALREIGGGDANLFAKIARQSTDRTVQLEALNSLCGARDEAAPGLMIKFWPQFNALQRRTALAELTRNKTVTAQLVQATVARKIDERDLNAQSIDRIRELLPDEAAARELVDRVSERFKPVLRLDGANDSFVDSNITLDGPFTVETWVKLDPGIGNEDGILGNPGGADFNFAGGYFRVFCGRAFGDRLTARRPLTANAWTHLGVTRDSKGVFRLYINGELDSTDPRAVTATFSDLDIGRTTPNRGTAGELTEYRVWNFARTGEEIRADFDRTFVGEPLPSGLVHYYPGAGPWGSLHGNAKVERVTDAPTLLTGEQARSQAAKFARFRALAEKGGNLEKGKAVFTATCMVCHSVAGQGGQIGPVLNGAAANGTEGLLRSVLTPNAAMEAGYRTFRVELKDGDTLDGFLVSRNDQAIILRQPNVEDRKIAMDMIRRADFIQLSIMPEGLLDNMAEQDVRNLFAYLQTLK
jgi:putative heme-binding domain-containing protein